MSMEFFTNTMNLARRTRLNRIFSHPSGRICTVAVDHFVGYSGRLPQGLRNVPATLSELLRSPPDAVTMTAGMARNAWEPYAGRCPLIVQAMCFTPDDSTSELLASPRDALALGADAIAVAIGVCGPSEGRYVKILADVVAQAAPLDLPVVAHIYPREFAGQPRIVHDPESILWAVRVGIECGADVIKVPYTGDVASFRDAVDSSPVPVVAAGGPRTATLGEALDSMREVVEAGARGATIGRNIWGQPDVAGTLRRFQEVLHGA